MTNLKRIGQIRVPVKDINRAVSFYRDLLGLTLLFDTKIMVSSTATASDLMLSLP